MHNELSRLFLTIALWSIGSALWGQLVEIPVYKNKANSQSLRTQRVQAVDTLSLPFWDDFSTSLLTPDSTKWLYGEHVNVNQGRGLNPPSINVASFDGTKIQSAHQFEFSSHPGGR